VIIIITPARAGKIGVCMNVYEVEKTNTLNLIVTAYVQEFKRRFQKAPAVTDDDRAAIRRLLAQVSIRKEDIPELIASYFELNDDWLKSKGFKLAFLERNYNAVLTLNAKLVNKTAYVIAVSQITGIPLISNQPKKVNPTYWHPVVELSMWRAMPFKDRLFGKTREEHYREGNEVDRWFETWRENHEYR